MNRFYDWMIDNFTPVQRPHGRRPMFSRIRKFLASTPEMKIISHIAFAFVSAFALTAIGTSEHAASTHGFSLSWSFLAGLALSAATAAFHTVRPQLLKLVASVATSKK